MDKIDIVSIDDKTPSNTNEPETFGTQLFFNQIFNITKLEVYLTSAILIAIFLFFLFFFYFYFFINRGWYRGVVVCLHIAIIAVRLKIYDILRGDTYQFCGG